MLNIDLYGNNFSHLKTPDGIYSMTDNRKPLFTKWCAGGSDISLFIDNEIFNKNIVDSVSSQYKIAMIVESGEISPDLYNLPDDIVERFDFILTYSDDLVKSSDKYIKYPFGGSWILEDNIKIHKKTKNVNLIYSAKTQTAGHRLRHEISNKLSEIDLFGSGCGRNFEKKEDVLSAYRYSIVVENTKMDGYFSEKLIDCFALGTIPIYWGCNKIHETFDINGIIVFNTIEELKDIISNISEEDYKSRLNAVQNNFKKVREFYCQEDWLYRNVLYKLDVAEKHIMSNCEPDHKLAFVEGRPQTCWLRSFFEADGDEQLYDFNLNSKSIVFDVGTYQYEYASEIIKKYNPIVHTFEPVTQFYNSYKHKKESINNNFALGKITEYFKINLNNDASSETGTGQMCLKVGFSEYVKKHRIQKIDLMKVNIEGGEYELIKYLIESQNIRMIDNLLIQFHPLENSGSKLREIMVKDLEKTHQRCNLYFPLVWEHWKLKK